MVEPWFVFWLDLSRRNTHGKTKKAWYATEAYEKGTIGISHTQIQPHDHDVIAESDQWLDIAEHRPRSQGLSSYCPLEQVRGGKMRNPGNEVRKIWIGQ